MKRVQIVLLLLTFLITMLPGTAFAFTGYCAEGEPNYLVLSSTGGKIELIIGEPQMWVNGTSQQIDPGKTTAPVLVNGKAFLPIRTVIETLGGRIAYDSGSKKVSISLNNKNIEMWIGKKNAFVNNQLITTDAEPFTSSTGRTMLPLRFVIDNLGFNVQWDSAGKKITIDMDPREQNSPGRNTENQGNKADSKTATPTWTGEWFTNLGYLTLQQTGNYVTGSCEASRLILTGTASGNLLEGTFITSKEGEDTGLFTLEMAANGKTFSGHFFYNNEKKWENWHGEKE